MSDAPRPVRRFRPDAATALPPGLPWGIREASWGTLELTENGRPFLDDPASFFLPLT